MEKCDREERIRVAKHNKEEREERVRAAKQDKE